MIYKVHTFPVPAFLLEGMIYAPSLFLIVHRKDTNGHAAFAETRRHPPSILNSLRHSSSPAAAPGNTSRSGPDFFSLRPASRGCFAGGWRDGDYRREGQINKILSSLELLRPYFFFPLRAAFQKTNICLLSHSRIYCQHNQSSVCQPVNEPVTAPIHHPRVNQ